MSEQKILFIKLSSLGDVIHSLPAIAEMRKHNPNNQICFATEENYADLLTNCSTVDKIFSIPLRRLRKKSAYFFWRDEQWKIIRNQLRAEKFDIAIDGQGLLKSAFVLKNAGVSNTFGFNRNTVREKAAALFYRNQIAVDKNMHAVERIRTLAALSFGYEISNNNNLPIIFSDELNKKEEIIFPELDYSLPKWEKNNSRDIYFFHGTTWVSKMLPVTVWEDLARIAIAENYVVNLIWGNSHEKLFCDFLSKRVGAGIKVADKILDFSEIIIRLKNSLGVIGVDTGLMHLAAAMEMPSLGLYGATNAALTGLYGKRALNLQARNPCMQKDCSKHTAVEANSCMSEAYKSRALEIWENFISLQQK